MVSCSVHREPPVRGTMCRQVRLQYLWERRCIEACSLRRECTSLAKKATRAATTTSTLRNSGADEFDHTRRGYSQRPLPGCSPGRSWRGDSAPTADISAGAENGPSATACEERVIAGELASAPDPSRTLGRDLLVGRVGCGCENLNPVKALPSASRPGWREGELRLFHISKASGGQVASDGVLRRGPATPKRIR